MIRRFKNECPSRVADLLGRGEPDMLKRRALREFLDDAQ